jgi:5-methylcytosine-specific restriction enzyme subunit McrC
VRQIPIRNLYYLFLYAWDRFPEGRHVNVGLDLSPDLPNLLSRVLISGTRSLLRRGLDRGYDNVVEVPASPRGRFLFGETIKRNSLISGRLVCAFDDLSVDIPHNRVLKAALQKLMRSPDVSNELANEMRGLDKRLAGVTSMPLSRELFRPLQLSRNSGHYGLLMRVCEMVLELALPEEGGTGSRFADILEDEERMSTIFESFVRNFYRQEQTSFSVGSEVITWEAECHIPDQASYLPTMVTDVTLRSPLRTIVIDAKFYRQTLVNRHGGRPKIRSDHLYQLQAYMRNMERRNRRGCRRSFAVPLS